MPLDTANERLCQDCGVPLVGRFCHACGEDSQPPRRELKFLIKDALDNVFSFTEHVPHTARDLALDPGRLLRGLRDGDRKRYLSPVKLYVTVTVLFFLFLAVSGESIFQLQVIRTGGPLNVVVENGELKALNGFRIEERWLHPRATVGRDPEAVRVLDGALAQLREPVSIAITTFVKRAADDAGALNDLIAEWAPRVLWLLMPLYALLLWPFYRRGTLVADHLIFALWAHTSLFLLLIVGSLWNFLGLGGGLLLALGLYQAYLTVGMKGFYGRSWAGAVLKGGLHSLLYFGLIWIPLTAAFFIWQVATHLPPSFWTE
ncbi:MAG TPA: DUF3667 domain-containing protein [Caulobacter sp.]|nr:DUF3667 domain-containing protein [Caulobacter sp.]